MQWAGDATEEHDVLVRDFEVSRDAHVVPGRLWTPTSPAGRRPLVLIGHGGSQSRSAPGIGEVAKRFAREHAFTAAAIDGPIHGARRSDGGQLGPHVQQEFRDMWERDTRIDFMVEDWRKALDALEQLPEVDAASVGWYGVSMGTAYGLPLIAADPRIRVAVLGMWGTNYPNSVRLAEDAPSVRCPVMFQMKWDDQFFTREGQLALFDRLGSERKWCKTYPGAHTPVEGVQLDDIVEFLVRGLQA
jgi:dienelactone hydrolase